MPGLLALLAHPDDEFFCAGLLAAVASRGFPLQLAYWTRGEGGGSPGRRLIWGCLPRSWHYRAREARRAGVVLGARSVDFLGTVDPTPIGNKAFAPDEPLESVVGKIDRLIARYQPELLFTHGTDGEYGHAAHRRLHEVAREFSGRLALASFAAAHPRAPRYANRSDPADFIFDSRPFNRQKMEILRAHRSQKMVFEGLADPARPTLRRLLRASRYEGYHVPGGEPAHGETLALLRRWTGDVAPVI
jgi:LmbE family N-acetylglucosaminyl deacetylase